jgi:general stress protein 26
MPDTAADTVDVAERFHSLVAGFKRALLVTRRGQRMHARPMAVAELIAGRDPVFVTSLDSPKVGEIEADPQVLVTFQSDLQFATITGRAAILRDKARIDELWSEAWRVWFPKGKDDPALCLIRIAADEGEYWDASGVQGLKSLFRGASAYLKGTRPTVDDKQHAKLPL